VVLGRSVADDVVVAAGAQQDADGGGVVVYDAVAELKQECLEPLDQGGLAVAFCGGPSEAEEVQDVRVTGEAPPFVRRVPRRRARHTLGRSGARACGA